MYKNNGSKLLKKPCTKYKETNENKRGVRLPKSYMAHGPRSEAQFHFTYKQGVCTSKNNLC